MVEKGDYVEPSPRNGLAIHPVPRFPSDLGSDAPSTWTATLEGIVNRHHPEKGESYRHEDGTAEVVFATVEQRVLTVREYPTIERFQQAIGAAESTGINEEVAAIPSIDAFREADDDHGNEES